MATIPFSPQSREMGSNFSHLYADIAWFGVTAGSVISFLAVYAARLDATSFQVGMLSAGPAVVNLFISLPAGRWIEGRSLIQTVFRSSVWHRIAYLALIPLPWLFSQLEQVWAMILITLVMSIPGAILVISFNALFADLVPPASRATVVGRRNAMVAVSITITSILCGQILDRISFPLNYQVVFAIGAFGALMSSYELSRLRANGELPPRLLKPLGNLAWPGLLRSRGVWRSPDLRHWLQTGSRSLLRFDQLRGSFGKFLLAYLAFYVFQYLPLPLFPLYFVHNLNLADSTISFGTALFYLMMMFASLGMNRINTRFTHRQVMVSGAILFGVYPLILYFTRSSFGYWTAALYGGTVIAFLSSGLVNRLMERVPEDDRPIHMALHNLSLNMGILLGSLAGPALADSLGLRETLLVSAGLRFLGAFLLMAWG